MKTLEDFDLGVIHNLIFNLGREKGIQEEAKLEKLFRAFVEDAESTNIKAPCRNCGLKFNLNNMEHECLEEDIWLNRYVKNSVLNKEVPQLHISKLKTKYPLRKGNQLVFRGLNFTTKEAYETFMAKVKDGFLTTAEITSWSLNYDYAKRFARCVQKGTRVHDEERIKEIELMIDESSNMTGYKGVILMADITKKQVLCDISETAIRDMKEYEVILLPGDHPVSVAHVIENKPGSTEWSIEEIKKIRKDAGI